LCQGHVTLRHQYQYLYHREPRTNLGVKARTKKILTTVELQKERSTTGGKTAFLTKPSSHTKQHQSSISCKKKQIGGKQVTQYRIGLNPRRGHRIFHMYTQQTSILAVGRGPGLLVVGPRLVQQEERVACGRRVQDHEPAGQRALGGRQPNRRCDNGVAKPSTRCAPQITPPKRCRTSTEFGEKEREKQCWMLTVCGHPVTRKPYSGGQQRPGRCTGGWSGGRLGTLRPPGGRRDRASYTCSL